MKERAHFYPAFDTFICRISIYIFYYFFILCKTQWSPVSSDDTKMRRPVCRWLIQYNRIGLLDTHKNNKITHIPVEEVGWHSIQIWEKEFKNFPIVLIQTYAKKITEMLELVSTLKTKLIIIKIWFLSQTSIKRQFSLHP